MNGQNNKVLISRVCVTCSGMSLNNPYGLQLMSLTHTSTCQWQPLAWLMHMHHRARELSPEPTSLSVFLSSTTS